MVSDSEETGSGWNVRGVEWLVGAGRGRMEWTEEGWFGQGGGWGKMGRDGVCGQRLRYPEECQAGSKCPGETSWGRDPAHRAR